MVRALKVGAGAFGRDNDRQVAGPLGLFVMAFTNEFFGFASAALGVTVLSEAYRILRGSTTSATLPPVPRRD